MARSLRVEYPDALYHVMSRGNAKQNIYIDDEDRRMFLKILEDTSQVYNFICHAYCLMENHFHVIFETPEANLSKIMRDMNGNYAQRFNRRHNIVGHLFQGRYKAFIIEKESYLLEVARYVVLNPVRAKKVDHPRQWRWSSYRATAGMVKTPMWLKVDWILGQFSTNRKNAVQQYRRFIAAGFGRIPTLKEGKEDAILGDQRFVDFIWERTKGSEKIKEIPRSERIVGRRTLEEIFDDINDLEERDKAIIFARKRCGYLNTEIASFLGIDNSTVGKIVNGTYNQK